MQNDLWDYMTTLRRMKAYRPRRMFPGHGPPIGAPGDGGYALEFLARYNTAAHHTAARLDGGMIGVVGRLIGVAGRYEAHRQSREDQVVQLLQQMTPVETKQQLIQQRGAGLNSDDFEAAGLGDKEAFAAADLNKDGMVDLEETLRGGGLSIVSDAELSSVWACPTTGLIARTLYQKTSAKRMNNAMMNIEKIMIKLSVDGAVQCVQRCDDGDDDDESGDVVFRAGGVAWKPRPFKRTYFGGSPFGWQQVGEVAWRWMGGTGQRAAL